MSQQVRVYRLLDFNYANINPDSTRAYPLMRIGDRLNELDIRMTAGTDHFDPIQLNLNIVGVAPASGTTINSIYQLITHDTTDMPNIRLKCADWNIAIAKNIKDAYVYQGEVRITDDCAFNEVAVMGLVANASNGTVTGKLRGLIIQMQGSSMPTDTMGIEIRNAGSGATIKDGIFINGATTITNGITMWDTIGSAFRFGTSAGVAHGGAAAAGVSGYIKIIVGSASYRVPYLANADS